MLPSQSEQEQQLQSLQQQIAAKEDDLRCHAEHLHQQKQQQDVEAQAIQQQIQQQQAQAQAAQTEAERIRTNAQHLIDEANRREMQQAQQQLAPVATPAAVPPVAIHPMTLDELAESQVHELVRECADSKQSTYEEVMEWISTAPANSEQDVVDLLFADLA